MNHSSLIVNKNFARAAIAVHIDNGIIAIIAQTLDVVFRGGDQIAWKACGRGFAGFIAVESWSKACSTLFRRGFSSSSLLKGVKGNVVSGASETSGCSGTLFGTAGVGAAFFSEKV